MALTALWLSVVVQSPNIQIIRISCRQLTPFGQRGSAIFFEGFAAVEMTVEIEMILTELDIGFIRARHLLILDFHHDPVFPA